MKFTELLSKKCTNDQNGSELGKVNESTELSLFEIFCARVGEGSAVMLADIYHDIYCTV